MVDEDEYCTCTDTRCVTTDCYDDFGYWDVCVACGKKIEFGHHYFNHYDGEDHDDDYAFD